MSSKSSLSTQRRPPVSAAEEQFNRAVRLAAEYGRDTKTRKPSFEKSTSNERFFFLHDDNGREIIRLPLALVARSGAINNERLAIAWARSMSYPVPVKPDGCLNAILVAVGLFMFVVPGIILLIYLDSKSRDYKRQMNELVSRWVDAGKPEPGVKSHVENQLAAVELKSATSDQLLEYKKMLDQGLVSQEEYETLRKKALGL